MTVGEVGLTKEKLLKAKEILSEPEVYTDEEFKHLDRMVKILGFANYKCLIGKGGEKVDWQELETYLKERNQ